MNARTLEKRRAKRRRKAASHMPTGHDALINAIEKGYITPQEAKQAIKQPVKIKEKKPKARIIYGLNTNSM